MCAITASACRPRCRQGCSRRSSRPSRPARAPAWDCRSVTTSSPSSTAARLPSRAGRANSPNLPCGCRAARRRPNPSRQREHRRERRAATASRCRNRRIEDGIRAVSARRRFPLPAPLVFRRVEYAARLRRAAPRAGGRDRAVRSRPRQCGAGRAVPPTGAARGELALAAGGGSRPHRQRRGAPKRRAPRDPRGGRSNADRRTGPNPTLRALLRRLRRERFSVLRPG